MRRASSSVAGSTRRSSRQPGRRKPASSVLNTCAVTGGAQRVSQARDAGRALHADAAGLGRVVQHVAVHTAAFQRQPMAPILPAEL